MPKRRTNGRLILALLLAAAGLSLATLAGPELQPAERPGQATAVPSPQISPATQDQTNTAAASVCTANCEATPIPAAIHLADMRGEVQIDPYGKYLLVVYVVVHGGDHVPLGRVKVEASIWWPGGGPAHRTRFTRDANGTARFPWGSTQAGHWKLCVDSLSREGYVYDPGAAEVPSCAEWTN